MAFTYGDLHTFFRLYQVREDTKRRNLVPAERHETAEAFAVLARDTRTYDGSGNDPEAPRRGQVGRPFLRNTPPEQVNENLGQGPDPRVVSRRLLWNPRKAQTLAPGINTLAVAWLQFQIHDWFDHDTDPGRRRSLAATDTLASLSVEATLNAGDENAPRFLNNQGHWWDGSQIYGANAEIALSLRVTAPRGWPGAKLRLDADHRLPRGMPHRLHKVLQNDVELSGFIRNWWIGLSVLHTAFAREHNAIVDELLRAREYDSSLTHAALDEWLYQRARLINGALMARIQTVEWTPAIVDSPSIRLGLFADWWGISGRQGVQLYRLAQQIQSALGKADGDVLDEEFTRALETLAGAALPPDMLTEARRFLIQGLPPRRRSPSSKERASDGSAIDYAMSEEFVSAYRMHSLLPEPFRIMLGMSVEELQLPEVSGAAAAAALDRYGIETIIHSLGRQSPAALRLNNLAHGLSELRIPGVPGVLDIGAVDILRDRERGLPRYAAFKRIMSRVTGPGNGMRPTPAIRAFGDICGDPEQADIEPDERERRIRDAHALSETYASVEDVDLQIGMLAEPLLPGFGFSWTAFEVFLLMTVLRLSADRFMTTDYRPEVYTKAGLEWIERNDLRSVLLRHYPNLAGALRPTSATRSVFLTRAWR